MSLYSKSINDISYGDIEDFCKETIPENTTLDYKGGFDKRSPNEQVTKLVSSLANADGGLVLFGVTTTKNDKGREIPDVIKGMAAADQPADRILKFCTSSIVPLIVPEISEIEIPGKADKSVVIVRVPASEAAPHHLSDGRMYIRTGDMSTLVTRDATAEEIDFMLGRRAKSIALRTTLLEQAEVRSRPPGTDPRLKVSVIPCFPQVRPLADTRTLLQLAKEGLFQFMDIKSSLSSAQNSLFKKRTSDYESARQPVNLYGEVNAYGMLFSERRLITDYFHECPTVECHKLLGVLQKLLEGARNVYERLAFSGLVHIQIKLQNIQHHKLYYPPETVPIGGGCIDPWFTISKVVAAGALLDDELFFDLVAEFCHSMNAPQLLTKTPETITKLRKQGTQVAEWLPM